MIQLLHGDCLDLMQNIPDNSIDFCLTDPPYGTTACKWDLVIPFDPMWRQLKRIVKDNGAICLFGSEPFSSHLRLSNLKMFKYDWVWCKNRPSNPNVAKHRPMNYIELIHIFSFGKENYYPIKTKGKRSNNNAYGISHSRTTGYKRKGTGNTSDLKYPKNYIIFDKVPPKFIQHPTQKPIKLLEYLINTYTLENETVLDFTMGSGSTGVACNNLNRGFIGIEKDGKIFNTSQQRILEQNDLRLLNHE